jgi:hypothetical protein
MSVEALISGGGIADVVLALLVLEGVVVGVAMRRTGFGLAGFTAGLAAGAFLVLALRAALAGSGWQAIATFLALAFVAHATELSIRLRRWKHGAT